MRIRRAVIGVFIAVISGSLLNLAPARAEVTRVGGGAAAVQITYYSQSQRDFLGRLLGEDTPLSLPFVVLPPAGSAQQSAQLAGQDVSGIGLHLLRATTEGYLTGNPYYAHSTASVADVAIPGTTIAAIRSECTWDVNGARASSTIVYANGDVASPPVNTIVPLSGNSYLALNEQYTEIDPSTGAQVIYVYGAHLYHVRDGGRRNYAYRELDVRVAFSSCDPLNIPSLSGLKLKGISD